VSEASLCVALGEIGQSPPELHAPNEPAAISGHSGVLSVKLCSDCR
jgi:hypothetical protein